MRNYVHKRLTEFIEKPRILDYARMRQHKRGGETVKCLRTILKNRTLLDFYISKLANRPIENIDTSVLAALYIGFADILFLNTPEHVSVSQAVELVDKSAKHLRGFVNALLRKQLREPLAIDTLLPTDTHERLAIETSHPMWMVRLFFDELGVEQATKVLHAHNGYAPRTIRVNTTIVDVQSLKEQLLPFCQKIEDSAHVAEALIVHGMVSMQNSDLQNIWQRGCFYFQNEAAQLCSHFARPTPGETVVDLCCAPGGKSTHMAQLMKNQGKVISIDHSAQRLRMVIENAKRLQLTNIETQCLDVRNDKTKRYMQQADVIILDAPCSALGTIRKSPEIKWLRTLEDVQQNAAKQKALLKHVFNSMRPGCRLIYSVCSFSKAETFDVQTCVRNDLPASKCIPLEMPEQKSSADELLRQGSFLSVPSQEYFDGYFTCAFTKV